MLPYCSKSLFDSVFFTQPIFQSILIVKSEWVAREF